MLDPVPTFLVRESVDLLLPFSTTLVNTSLMKVAPSVTEARDSDAASQEIGSRPDRHRQLSASVESDLHVEGH